MDEPMVVIVCKDSYSNYRAYLIPKASFSDIQRDELNKKLKEDSGIWLEILPTYVVENLQALEANIENELKNTIEELSLWCCNEKEWRNNVRSAYRNSVRSAIEKGLADLAAGRVKSMEEVRKKYGLDSSGDEQRCSICSKNIQKEEYQKHEVICRTMYQNIYKLRVVTSYEYHDEVYKFGEALFEAINYEQLKQKEAEQLQKKEAENKRKILMDCTKTQSEDRNADFMGNCAQLYFEDKNAYEAWQQLSKDDPQLRLEDVVEAFKFLDYLKNQNDIGM